MQLFTLKIYLTTTGCFMFLELQGCCDQKKSNAKEKLPVEKWPQIFDSMNNSIFGTFCYIFGAFLEAPLKYFLEKSETTISIQFCLRFQF